jgi:uncharacterized paraquat-inducible protein A
MREKMRKWVKCSECGCRTQHLVDAPNEDSGEVMRYCPECRHMIIFQWATSYDIAIYDTVRVTDG